MPPDGDAPRNDYAGEVVAPMLSRRLAALELLDLETAELCEVVAEEATKLVGDGRAVVWLHQPAINRLFAEQRGRETRSIDLPDEALAATFSDLSSSSTVHSGLRRSIAELSFGVAAHGDPAPAMAIPLRAGNGLVGLVLVELAPDEAAPSIAGLDAFAQQAATVLVNHQALTRTRRHEAQLEALYQTAGEVSANLDLQTVLSAIVERARTLVEAPIGYVTLSDESRDEMYMRAAVGVTTEEFREIRLRIGSGLGGASAESDRPVYTSDYLNDARFHHTTEVDAAVRLEGIKSILGVPLRASAVLVGVLYVADRAVRVFTESDVEILQSLAHHAAVAINNAAVYEQATDALAQISKINQVAERQNRLLRDAEEIHRQLSEVVLRGDGLPSIAEVLSHLMGAHVVVADDHGRVRSSAGTAADTFGTTLAASGLTKPPPGDTALAQAMRSVAGFETTIVPSDGGERLKDRLVVPVVARGEVLGSVWTEIEGDEPRVRRNMEEASRVIALELLKESSIAEVERRMGRELLDALLSERPAAAASLERRAGDLGVDLTRPHHLAVAATGIEGTRARRSREEMTRRLACLPRVAFVAEHGDRLVLLLEEHDAAQARRLAQVLEASPTAKLIVSGTCTTPAQYRSSFVAADRALALLGDELGGPVVDLEDLRVIALLFGGERDREMREFVEGSLGALMRLDERQGPDLLRTLEAYLQSGGSAARTAGLLHVHVNTVYYRLERLREILGDALDDPRKALDLHVALLARRLMQKALEGSSNQTTQSS